MNLQSFHHIAIIGSNYEKSRHFYVDLLELPVIREHHRPEKGDTKIDLQFADGEIELFIKPDAPKRPNYPEALGLRHLAFKVTDMEATVAWLAAKGIECEPIRMDEITNKKMTFFFDPDGLPLELHE